MRRFDKIKKTVEIIIIPKPPTWKRTSNKTIPRSLKTELISTVVSPVTLTVLIAKKNKSIKGTCESGSLKIGRQNNK